MPSRASIQVLIQARAAQGGDALHQCRGSWAAGVRNSSPGAEQNIRSLELTCHHCFHRNSVNHKGVKGAFITPPNPGHATDHTGLAAPMPGLDTSGDEMQAAQIHSMSPLIPVSQGPKNVRSQHLNSVCLSLSFHFDQHLQPAAGADPESQGCFLRLSGERATRFPFHYVGFQSATSLMSLQRA